MNEKYHYFQPKYISNVYHIVLTWIQIFHIFCDVFSERSPDFKGGIFWPTCVRSFLNSKTAK